MSHQAHRVRQEHVLEVLRFVRMAVTLVREDVPSGVWVRGHSWRDALENVAIRELARAVSGGLTLVSPQSAVDTLMRFEGAVEDFWAKVDDGIADLRRRIEANRLAKEFPVHPQTAWRVLDLVGSRAVARQVIRLALMTNTDPIELATRCVEEDE